MIGRNFCNKVWFFDNIKAIYKINMKISDHITYAEAIHSNTAKRKGIDNTPSEAQVEAMRLLAEKIFSMCDS